MAAEFDGPDGSVKNADIKGHPGKLMIEKEDGEITEVRYLLFVAERLLVTADGTGGVTADELKSAVSKIALDDLVEMAVK